MLDVSKGGRAVVRVETTLDGEVTLPDHHATTDYTALAASLVTTHLGGIAEIDTEKNDHVRRVAALGQTMLQRVQEQCQGLGKLTELQWVEFLKSPVEVAYTKAGMKDVKGSVSRMKVAVLGFANNIPVGDAVSFTEYVNKVARPALVELGVLKSSKKTAADGTETTVGRPKGSTAVKVLDAREEAAEVLSGDPDDDEAKQWRIKALMFATTPGNWKLLEKKLGEMAKTLSWDF
jgi:hypothetical protein